MKRYRNSLTARIFLLTAGFMMLACAITYAAIAYLTPLSYTSLMEEELKRESLTLLNRLEQSDAAHCNDLLQDFARRTGAYLRLTDERETVLYDTLSSAFAQAVLEDDPAQAQAFDAEAEKGNSAIQQDDPATRAFDAEAEQGNSVVQISDMGLAAPQPPLSCDVLTESAASSIEQVVITSGTQVLSSSNVYALQFSDGLGAELIIQGGTRAVNQVAEAMKTLLPYLLIALLVLSLTGAWVYARFITRPIVSISRIATRMAAQDFRARWSERRADEIGALGDSLNLLSDNLSGALSQLTLANQTLQRDIDRERALEAQRLAFFCAASHELKTPVTILKGQLSGMLARVGIYKDREKYLARALEVTGRMEGLIKEILTISRIESGNFALHAAPVDLSALAQKLLTLDEELIDQKQMCVEVDIEPNVMVSGNENLLFNALDNVLLNAILYSPPGAAIRMQVRAQAFRLDNTQATIPSDALPQIFDPFYRVEQSRNRNSGGSGLGLYLVKRILQLHGAACGMENLPDGVRFTVAFPPAMQSPADPCALADGGGGALE